METVRGHKKHRLCVKSADPLSPNEHKKIKKRAARKVTRASGGKQHFCTSVNEIITLQDALKGSQPARKMRNTRPTKQRQKVVH